MQESTPPTCVYCDTIYQTTKKIKLQKQAYYALCIHYETREFATREGLRNHNFDIHKKWTLLKSIFIYI